MAKKRAHKTLPLSDKIQIIEALNRGECGKNLAEKFDVGASTISDIKKNAENIKRFAENSDSNLLKQRKTLKLAENEEFERKLYAWLETSRLRHQTISSEIIRHKAKSLYQEMYPNQSFKASNGWLEKFKKRFSLRTWEIYDESLSARPDVSGHAEVFKETSSTAYTGIPPQQAQQIDGVHMRVLTSFPGTQFLVPQDDLVWKYFVPSADNSYAMCQLCNQFCLCLGGSTTALKVHLQTLHADIYNNESTQQTPGYSSPSYEISTQKSQPYRQYAVKELPDQADDSHSNFESFSNADQSMQQSSDGHEMYTIIEQAPVPTLPTPSPRPPNAKRQKRNASERANESYADYSENVENIENIPNNHQYQQQQQQQQPQQIFEYPKWKDERYDLFGKMILMKIHDVPSDAQKIFAEKLINEALSLAELNLLTPAHVINAPFVPMRPPLCAHRRYPLTEIKEPNANAAPPVRNGTSSPPATRNQEVTGDARASPANLDENSQNISPTTQPPKQNTTSIPKPTDQPINPQIDKSKRPSIDTAATMTSSPQTKIEKQNSVLIQRDASDVFGEHVASKHRQYSDYVRSYVEHSISQNLFEADMGKYESPPGHWEQIQGIQQRSTATQVKCSDTGTNNNNGNTNTTAVSRRVRPPSVGAAQQTKTATTTTQPSTSKAAFSTISVPRPSTSTSAAAHRTAAGSIDHSKTATAQHSNAAAGNIEQPHLLDPNIVIKSSPAHAPSYSSDIDDDETETILSNTGGAPPYVANERMSDDEEISNYNF